MSAATSIRPLTRTLSPVEHTEITLLDLVSAVSEECENEAEVVATVLHILESGRARLGGNFRRASLRDLCRA